MVLYLPMLVFGRVIPVPPLVFGSAIAWWLLAAGIFGLVVILFLVPKFSTVKLDLRAAISDSFDRHGLIVAIGLFALLYFTASVVEALFAENLRIVVPIFNDLMPTKRILMFVMFVPFFLVYFFVEGLYLHELPGWPAQNSVPSSKVFAVSRVIGIKISPYVAVLCVQYVPMFLLGVRPFPGFVGFFIEFLWAVVPFFVVSTACSWRFYRNTSTVGTGAVFNSLLFAWVAAGLFPFGAFP